MTTVTVSNLSKTYPGSDTPALDALNLEIPSGSLTAVLGPSGCGKTTLLKLITGLIAPSKGNILYDGESVLGLAPEERETALVFQNHMLFPHMSVAANIGFGLRMRNRPETEIKSEVERMLSLVRLQEFGERQPQQLSGGQQQRVALARALVIKPRLMLLDEPLSNLDANLRIDMRDFIRELQHETGVTCILVTHDQEEALVMADKIALLSHGRLLQHAAPEDFFEQPSSAAVARFFNAKNMIAAEHDGALMRCGLGEFAIPAPSGGAGNYLAVIRPERLRLVAEKTADTLACEIIAARYLGSKCLLTAIAGDNIRLNIEAPPQILRRHKAGEELSLQISCEDFWLVPRDESTESGLRN